MSIETERFQVAATDGYTLGAYRYRAASPRGIVVVASATGVPQAFYRRFAQFVATEHYDVVTFDYRGLGESAPSSLKGFEMDYRDWATKDLEAVVAMLSAESLPLYLVGHSYGGHALGLISNHECIRAACFFGVGSGWHGWMPRLEGIRVWLMWHLIAPVLVQARGYLGWSVLGMGEDLPMGVYRQWKRWCGFPGYFFDDPQQPQMKHKFAQVKTPIRAFTALDDLWALPASRDAFVRHYTSSRVEKTEIEPKAFGAAIGHMGYFRSRAQPLWPQALAFFEAHQGVSPEAAGGR
ncbi:MAG: alpha/beta fold hydrolase [Pseudomonadota bacterium]